MAELMDPELIEHALELEEVDRDLYRSVRLWKPMGGRGTFGGQVVAQAARAATLSVLRDEGPGKGIHRYTGLVLVRNHMSLT